MPTQSHTNHLLGSPVDVRLLIVNAKENVPSLINHAGYFYDFEHMPEFFAQISLVELELEFKAQI